MDNKPEHVSSSDFARYKQRQRNQKERNPTNEEYRKAIEGKYWCERTLQWKRRP